MWVGRGPSCQMRRWGDAANGARREGEKKVTGWDMCLLQRGDIPIGLWMGLGGWDGEKDRKGLEGEGSLR